MKEVTIIKADEGTRKPFEDAALELLRFSRQDVITTSTTFDGDEDNIGEFDIYGRVQS